MATTHRSTRARFSACSSEALEDLLWIAEGESAPCRRVAGLVAGLLFERQLATPASSPVWMKPAELPF